MNTNMQDKINAIGKQYSKLIKAGLEERGSKGGITNGIGYTLGKYLQTVIGNLNRDFMMAHESPAAFYEQGGMFSIDKQLFNSIEEEQVDDIWDADCIQFTLSFRYFQTSTPSFDATAAFEAIKKAMGLHKLRKDYQREYTAQDFTMARPIVEAYYLQGYDYKPA